MTLKSTAIMLVLVLLLLTISSGVSDFSILLDPNGTCKIKPCYTLSQVIDNPSQYFTPDTSVVFPPGNYDVSSGQLVIQNVHKISLVGSNPDKTVIQCQGQFGLAFINITNLTISNLQFSMCGVPLSDFGQNETTYIAESLKYHTPISLYLVHINNLNIHNVGICNTKGVGILGANLLGVSSIHRAMLVNNTINYITIYLDTNYFSPLSPILPSVLNITDSQFSFGSTLNHYFASGLNIVAEQSTYHIYIYITNVITNNNTNSNCCVGIFGNMLLSIKFCILVSIQMKGIHCTEGGRQGLGLKNTYDGSMPENYTPDLRQQFPAEYILQISDSYFGRNGISLTAYCSVKLEHVTIENNYNGLTLIADINNKSLFVLKEVNFSYNTHALYIGSDGTLKVEFYGWNKFIGNQCHNSVTNCVPALGVTYCNVTFYGNTTFQRNRGSYSPGAAVYAEHSKINFQGTALFQENEGEYGGAMTLHQNVSVVVEKLAGVRFFGNHARKSGGAIYARGSQIAVRNGGNLLFIENKAYNGGAMALLPVVSFDESPFKLEVPVTDFDPTITLETNSQVIFTRNHAYHYGGAIYYEDEYKDVFAKLYLAYFHACFYKFVITDVPGVSYDALFDYTLNNTDVDFHNNTAGFAGTAIYGGWVDMCKWYISYQGIVPVRSLIPLPMISVFDKMFHFHVNSQDLSLITSNPTRVCICTNTFPDCNATEYTVTAYPGETFKVSAVAVGQRFGTVPDIVQSSFVSGKYGNIPALQRTQLASATCTDLTYTVLSPPNRTEIMSLTIDRINVPSYRIANDFVALTGGTEWDKYFIGGQITRSTHTFTPIDPTLFWMQFQNLSIHIEVQFCPLGFVFNTISQTCICHPKLLENGINCSIDTQTITRENPIWINATFLNDTYTQVLIHNHCPFDYCKDESIQLNMVHPDEQCAFFRTGVLCGSCQQNLSQVLGTSNCRECSSLQLLWMVPTFVTAGIVLVILLMVFNLTVSVGTINGLIFYANIVRANQAIYFPPTTSSSFLSIFIAWLNLDLGIETCFYNGLDAYVKTWLQFLFPMYIWIMVILIIVSSHYSTTAAKLSGRNAVQVLATLFLLSYAKLLRITITTFSFTLLEYPDNYIKKIWLYDGNVEYLKGKHIALFLVVITLLLTISVPYTAALVFIQCLQRRSRYRILLWVWRLKPLFDAYTGPYKDTHRYWPGLLLVVRVALFLVFSVNVSGNTAINLCAVAITTTCIMFYTVVNQGGIYKSKVLNAIEYSFFLNLSTLSIITLFVMLTDGDQTVVVYTSVSIAYITFMFILLYHIIWRVSSEQQRKRFTEWAITKLKVLIRRLCRRTSEENCQNVNPPPPPHMVPLIGLREPVMDYCN